MLLLDHWVESRQGNWWLDSDWTKLKDYPVNIAAFKMTATGCLRSILIGMFTFVQRNNCSLWRYILVFLHINQWKQEQASSQPPCIEFNRKDAIVGFFSPHLKTKMNLKMSWKYFYLSFSKSLVRQSKWMPWRLANLFIIVNSSGFEGEKSHQTLLCVDVNFQISE